MSQIIMGTSHFVSVNCAVRYYRDHGYSRDEVMQKLKEKEIHIGEPPLQAGDKLGIIFGEGRYQVTINHPEKKAARIDPTQDKADCRLLKELDALPVFEVFVSDRALNGKIRKYGVRSGEFERVESFKSKADAQALADKINAELNSH